MVEPIDIRTGKPFASRRPHLHHSAPPSECASLGGNLGRARGLMGGCFTGCMMASQSPSLPYDYEVECLISNGSQYIDTGIMFDTDTDELYVRFVATRNANYAIAGSSNTAEPRNRVAFWNDYRCADLARTQSQVGTYRAYVTSPQYNVDCEGYISKSLRYVAANGTRESENTVAFTDHFVTEMPIYIFWASYGAQEKASIWCKYAYIKRNGEYLMDAIPVVSDGIPCLYDRARRVLLANQTSGHQFGYKRLDGTIVNPY